jgi:hypothetical protein
LVNIICRQGKPVAELARRRRVVLDPNMGLDRNEKFVAARSYVNFMAAWRPIICFETVRNLELLQIFAVESFGIFLVRSRHMV